MFAVMDDEEKLPFGLFLSSGVWDAEMQNIEYTDFNWEKRSNGFCLQVATKSTRVMSSRGCKLF